MQRFKRIATHGWLDRALSIFTFGYYPFSEVPPVPGPVDWCVGDERLYAWAANAIPLSSWCAGAAHASTWAAAVASVQSWSVTVAPSYTWSTSVEVFTCE